MGESGTELEDLACTRLNQMGFDCIHRLKQAPLKDLDPAGSFSSGEHLELDFLLPHGELCIIGEITARKNPSDIKKKYKAFRSHINILKKINPLDESQWITIGVPEKKLPLFGEILELKFIFIITELQRFDVELTAVPDVAILYKKDWFLLQEYAQTIGKFSKQHFLAKFNIAPSPSVNSLVIQEKTHNLFRTHSKQIVSGSETLTTDIFTFEINPYDLLGKATVFRADDLPSLSEEDSDKYQRPLQKAKLQKIRKILANTEAFIFPSNILVVLSPQCSFDIKKHKLEIPDVHGAIEVIDGQHRLFSYASSDLEAELKSKAKIIVTAIKFKTTDIDKIRKFSARTFVEINTNQTKVAPNHIAAIKYPLLGVKDGVAISAQVVIAANELKGKSTYGLFDTYQTGLGIIKATTVLTALKPIFNIETIKKLQRAPDSSPDKNGYRNIFDHELPVLQDPDKLIEYGSNALARYLNVVRKVFDKDWPVRNAPKGSALELAKVMAAFIKLLHQFIKEGKTWDGIEADMNTIKGNLIKLRNKAYDENDILLDPKLKSFPDSQISAANNLKFLEANRHKSTSMTDILPENKFS